MGDFPLEFTVKISRESFPALALGMVSAAPAATRAGAKDASPPEGFYPPLALPLVSEVSETTGGRGEGQAVVQNSFWFSFTKETL